MSLVGLNITFGFIVTSQDQQITQAPIFGPSTDSDLFTAADVTTAEAADPPNKTMKTAVFLDASADWWVTIGPNPPDPTTVSPEGGRHIVRADVAKQIFCNPGDKVRGAPA